MAPRFPWLAVAIVMAACLPAAAAITIVPVAPAGEGAVVRSLTPTLEFNVTGPQGPVTADQATLAIDKNATDAESLRISNGQIAFTVPSILPLARGNHTLDLDVVAQGSKAHLSLAFVVDDRVTSEGKPFLTLGAVVLVASLTLAVVAAGAAGGYVYLRRTRRFTIRKFLLRNPVQRKYLVLYVPLGVAVAGCLLALVYFAANPGPRFAIEYTLLAAFAVAVVPYAVDVKRGERRRIVEDRAFAQFLFELADALRGGIDPMKAIIELSKAEDGILRKNLRIAADNIRLGQPFDAVMRGMSKGVGSPLVGRYATLVGEAATMGGGVAQVIHRAAQDMHEMVKIDEERRRQMRTPVMTVYMAFIVLLLMILQLIGFAPQLSGIDASALFGGKNGVPRLSLDVMETRMFHLLIINALGAGLLVGAFAKGQVRHGLLHATLLLAVSVAIYPLTIPH